MIPKHLLPFAVFIFVCGLLLGRSTVSVPPASPPVLSCRDSAISAYALDQQPTGVSCLPGARVLVDRAAGIVTCECPDVPEAPTIPSAVVSPWEVQP